MNIKDQEMETYQFFVLHQYLDEELCLMKPL